MAHAGDPKIKNARLMQASEHSEGVCNQSDEQNPPGLEHEEKLDRDDAIYDEEGVGYTCENLRPCEGNKNRVVLEFGLHVFSTPRAISAMPCQRIY